MNFFAAVAREIARKAANSPACWCKRGAVAAGEPLRGILLYLVAQRADFDGATSVDGAPRGESDRGGEEHGCTRSVPWV